MCNGTRKKNLKYANSQIERMDILNIYSWYWQIILVQSYDLFLYKESM